MSASAPAHEPRVSTWAAMGAFFRRDVRVALSYKVPFMLEIVAIGFTVVTYTFLAKIVSPGSVPGGYFAFVLLGLTVSSFLGAGISVLGANLRQEQVQGTLEALLASGIPVRGLAAGMASYPVIEAMWTAVIYVAVGILAGARAEAGANWPLALVAVVIGSLSFVGLGLVGAALVLVFRRAAAATGWLLAVMSLAGGEFFPPSLLPGWFRALAQFSPFTQALRITREAVLAAAGWEDEGARLAALLGMAVFYVSLGIWALALGLRHARRTGSLSGY